MAIEKLKSVVGQRREAKRKLGRKSDEVGSGGRERRRLRQFKLRLDTALGGI